LSADGNKQYSEVPVGERLDNLPPYENFASTVQRFLTGSTSENPIEGLGTVSSMITNDDGDQLVLVAGSDSDSVASGYALYQRSSDTL
jgi:hypothetical protein